MIMLGKIAQAKGKCLPLVVVYIPYMGYFIGTKSIVNGHSKPFTRESVEIWSTEEEAHEALTSNSWEQAISCNIDGMD